MQCKNINYCIFHQILVKNTLNMSIEIEKCEKYQISKKSLKKYGK